MPRRRLSGCMLALCVHIANVIVRPPLAWLLAPYIVGLGLVRRAIANASIRASGDGYVVGFAWAAYANLGVYREESGIPYDQSAVAFCSLDEHQRVVSSYFGPHIVGRWRWASSAQCQPPRPPHEPKRSLIACFKPVLLYVPPCAPSVVAWR